MTAPNGHLSRDAFEDTQMQIRLASTRTQAKGTLSVHRKRTLREEVHLDVSAQTRRKPRVGKTTGAVHVNNFVKLDLLGNSLPCSFFCLNEVGVS